MVGGSSPPSRTIPFFPEFPDDSSEKTPRPIRDGTCRPAGLMTYAGRASGSRPSSPWPCPSSPPGSGGGCPTGWGGPATRCTPRPGRRPSRSRATAAGTRAIRRCTSRSSRGCPGRCGSASPPPASARRSGSSGSSSSPAGSASLLALATLVLVYRVGREIYDRRSALFTAAVVMCVAPFVYYAKMGNLDIPYIFWFTLSLLFYVRILKHHRLRDYVLFALMAAATVCTKDQAYGLYGLAPLPILWSLARREHGERGVLGGLGRALIDRRFLAAAAAAAVGFAVFQMLWNWNRFALHVRLLLGPMSDNYQDYENTPEGHEALLTLFLRQIAFCMNPALALVGIAGVAWTLWRLFKRHQGTGDEPFLIAQPGVPDRLVLRHLPEPHPVQLRPVHPADRAAPGLPRRAAARRPGGAGTARGAPPRRRWRRSSATPSSTRPRWMPGSSPTRATTWRRTCGSTPRLPGGEVGGGHRPAQAHPALPLDPLGPGAAHAGQVCWRGSVPPYVAINLSDLPARERDPVLPAHAARRAGLQPGPAAPRQAPASTCWTSKGWGRSQRFINPEIALFERNGHRTHGQRASSRGRLSRWHSGEGPRACTLVLSEHFR